mgnify:CR=1 FL=1
MLASFKKNIFYFIVYTKKLEKGNIASDYFQIDKVSGVLSIRKRIDLESYEIAQLGGLLEFKIAAFEVGDEMSREETQITIAISDINDNSPKFNSKSYSLNVNPLSAAGTSLTLIDNAFDESIRAFDLDKVS